MASLLGFNNVNTTFINSHTSDNVANISISSNIFIRIAEFSYPLLSSSGVLGTFLIMTIFNSGSINYHFANSQYKLSTNGNIGNLSRINIELVDAYTKTTYAFIPVVNTSEYNSDVVSAVTVLPNGKVEIWREKMPGTGSWDGSGSGWDDLVFMYLTV